METTILMTPTPPSYRYTSSSNRYVRGKDEKGRENFIMAAIEWQEKYGAYAEDNTRCPDMKTPAVRGWEFINYNVHDNMS